MPVHKLCSFLSWLLVAALLTLLSLRLFAAPSLRPASATPTALATVNPSDLEQLLTSGPAALPITAAPSAPIASSQLKLQGIIREPALTSGLALISIDDKRAKPYTVGQFISPGLQLVSLNAGEVTLSKDGQSMRLVLPVKVPQKMLSTPMAAPLATPPAESTEIDPNSASE